MFTTQFKPLRATALVSAICAALLGTCLTNLASATLVINLRFDDTGTGGTSTKNISAMSAGQTVVIEVWATVLGTDSSNTNDGLNSSFFGVASNTASVTANLTGNITAGNVVTPFSFAAPDGGSPGTFADRNADGIGDWRGTGTTASGGWAKQGHGTTQEMAGGSVGHANAINAVAWDFHIADAVFTIGSITLPGSGTINALTLDAAVLGSLGALNNGKASWMEEGVSKFGTATLPSAGTGVTFTLGTGAAQNPDIDPTPTSLAFNLLRNAVVPTKDVTLNNVGQATGNYTTTPAGLASVASGGAGSIGAGLNAIMGVTVTGGTAAFQTSLVGNTVTINTPNDPDAPSGDVVTVTKIVGEANTTGTTFAGALILTANVAATSGTYTGLESRTTVGGGNVGTTATMLAGGNTTGAAEDVNMQWRQRTLNEKGVAEGGTPTSPPLPPAIPGNALPVLISDVVNLTGLDYEGTGDAAGRTDVYVLQMTYDPNKLVGGILTEGDKADVHAIYLAWLNPNGGGAGTPQWENATIGNFNNAPYPTRLFDFHGTYAQALASVGNPAILPIGSYGVDTIAHTVWAVLDHASEFAVVPEPASILLLGVGGVGLLVGLRRRRR